MRLALIFAILALCTRAAADEVTSKDIESAPAPGDESGRTDPPDDDSTARKVGRGILFVPRAAVEVAFAPVRGGIWAFDRYRLADRFKQVFFDDTETYGLYPTGRIESDYGVTVGARFTHADLFGDRERLSLQVGIGGSYRQRYEARLQTGERFGESVQLELDGEVDRRPREVYYGIGNTDGAMKTYHRQEMDRAAMTADAGVIGNLHLLTVGALSNLRYAASDEGPAIDDMYDPTEIPGWPGMRNLYAELELRWDGRRTVTTLEQRSLYAYGTMVGVFSGRVYQLEAGRDYFRYGADAQQFIRLGPGPRVLFARMHVESITADVEDAAFTQLPELGGRLWLRGYSRERFRDRATAVGSLEYSWDLGRFVRASVFSDVGRVFPSLRDVGVDGLRVGYGMSLQLHADRDFLGSFSIASSIDGGVFFNLSFDPVFEIEPRVEDK